MEMKILVIFVICVNSIYTTIFPSIPPHLLECYRGGGPELGAPKRIDVILSLIRKLETYSQLDLRLFSTALLRSTRLDGIEQSANAVETEFVTPYRASAFQFHRYKLLMDLFLPSQNILDVDESLTLIEKCTLHKMLSSGVSLWERGDESVVCPLSAENRQSLMQSTNGSRQTSRCPIEEGLILTDWGNISPGVLISALGSSLEPQRVTVTDILNADVFKESVAEPLMTTAKQEWFTDIETLNVDDNLPRSDVVDISNIWVSTLAGDLAEVIVNQGPRVGSSSQKIVIGNNGKWNDTLLPRDYYIHRQNSSFADWQFTDAEILAGIDGLILAKHLPSWIQERRSLRLSQIMDMYYSDNGVSFNTRIKACNRQTLFTDIFNSTQLLIESSRFAHVLSLNQGVVYIPKEEMDRISQAAVDAFVNYLPIILQQNTRECTTARQKPVLDLIVATDASWKGYQVQQFMSWLTGALELDLLPSSISLVHGNTGQWIAPPSHNATDMFSHINNYTEEWPNRLNLPSIITTVLQYSLNKSISEAESQVSAGPSTLVLIISPQDKPSATEIERSKELMDTLRESYFDVYFAYLSQDLTDYENVNNEYMDYSEMFLKTTSTTVNDVIAAVETNIIKGEIPFKIIGQHCSVNGTDFPQMPYEDFVLPDLTRSYRIHPFYVRLQPSVNVQFSNSGQGQVLICTWRGAETSHSCQTLGDRISYTFNITDPCPSSDFCPPIHFSVTALSSSNTCANNDCRLPNQVSFLTQHTGLKCLPLRSSGNVSHFSLYIYFSTLMAYLLMFNYKNI